MPGLQKARAREKCTGEFCWQQDSDERVSPFAAQKIKGMCQQFPKFIDIIALPVVEFWGKEEKIRMDVTPWKWRLSRNKGYITHGIPKELRKVDDEGNVYSLPGSDGCDYVNSETYERLPHASFIHRMRTMQELQQFRVMKQHSKIIPHGLKES